MITFFCSGRPISLWGSALVLVASVIAAGCRRSAEPTSRESTPIEPTRPAAIAGARSSACALSAWTDLDVARQQPQFKAARDKIIAGLDTGPMELARSAGLDIEQWSHEATICELEGDRHRRALVFRGSYPPDLIERIVRVVPGASRPVGSREGVVRVGPGWMGATSDRLVWADDREVFDRAFGGDLANPDLPRNGILSTSMSRKRAEVALAGLEASRALEDSNWSSVTVTLGRDGKSSEVRFTTQSSGDATRLLATIR